MFQTFGATDACQRKSPFRSLLMTSGTSGLVPGKDGLFTADAGVPLGPPAPKLIPKQKLLSNGEPKPSLWNAVAMASSGREVRVFCTNGYRCRL